MGYMVDKLGEAETLNQLAEELAEAAHAALKLARILRGINPTPDTEKDTRANLIEEYSDIINCARDIGLEPCEDLIRLKQERFRWRWGVKERTGQQGEHQEPAVLKLAREVDEAMMEKPEISRDTGEITPEEYLDIIRRMRETFKEIMAITGRYEDQYYG